MRPGELEAPRRNRYFYGKLLDVLHLTMEQEYGIARERRHNRLVLGAGVVCGLRVEVVQDPLGDGLVISPGVAIDGSGREIVVPGEVELIPLQLTDECGAPVPDPSQLPARVTVSLCARECRTDFGPVLVADTCCNGDGDTCEAGTIVESFCLRVRDATGLKHSASAGCADDVLNALRRGDTATALLLLADGDCAAPPADACVVLAEVIAKKGALNVQDPVRRPVVPTNRLLLELIGCLAARVEECCAGGPTPAPTEPPTEAPTEAPTEPPDEPPTEPPTEPPIPVGRLKVASVVLQGPGGPLVQLVNPADHPTVSRAQEPLGFVAGFKGATIDPNTVDTTTVVVTSGGAVVAGSAKPRPGNRSLEFLTALPLPKGDYVVTLRGDAPAIMSNPTAVLPAVALDGNTQPGQDWPTGDNTPGGNYAFAFTVTD